MSKLDAVKQKIEALKASLNEKLDKIAFLKKFRSKHASAPSDSQAGNKAKSPSIGLASIYREGSTATRLQVILVYALFIGALIATGIASKSFFQRIRHSAEHEQVGKDMSHGLEVMHEKVIEKANMVYLNKFTVNVFAGGKSGRLMAVDIWIRVSEPDTAQFVQKNETMIYDRITDSFQNIYRSQIDILKESGKEEAKKIILDSINKTVPKGKADEIFFENLVVQ
jgi:hypothetical protein